MALKWNDILRDHESKGHQWKLARTLQATVAAAAMGLASPGANAGATPGYLDFDSNEVNGYVMTFSWSALGKNVFNHSISIGYGLLDTETGDSVNGDTILRPINEWEDPGFDFITQFFDTQNQQIIDAGIDFKDFEWLDEPQGFFTFTDKNGNPFSGVMSEDKVSILVDSYGLIAFEKVSGPVPAVPEPGVIYLLWAWFAWIWANYMLRRRKNEAKK